MKIDITIGDYQREPGKEYNERHAVRGIVLDRGKRLMIHSNRGTYECPGGGIDVGETKEEALAREIEEESGYKVTEVLEYLGVIVERRQDVYDTGRMFEMHSHYYCCRVDQTKGKQILENYEKELGYQGVWITIDEAIASNERYLEMESGGLRRWIERENHVLNTVKRLYNYNM